MQLTGDMRCDVYGCGGTFGESIKAGLFQYCPKHFQEFQKICNSRGCDNLIALSDIGRWVLCPDHKKMSETTEGYRELERIGFKNKGK